MCLYKHRYVPNLYAYLNTHMYICSCKHTYVHPCMHTCMQAIQGLQQRSRFGDESDVLALEAMEMNRGRQKFCSRSSADRCYAVPVSHLWGVFDSGMRFPRLIFSQDVIESGSAAFCSVKFVQRLWLLLACRCVLLGLGKVGQPVSMVPIAKSQTPNVPEGPRNSGTM